MVKLNVRSFLNKHNDASILSAPAAKEVFGVKIRKLPNGAYIKALNQIQNMPQVILEGCFPGLSTDEVIDKFTTISAETIPALAGKLLATVPEQFLKFISTLIDVSEEKLINELTPSETITILEEFWKINNMSTFFERLKRMVMNGSKTLTEMRPKT